MKKSKSLFYYAFLCVIAVVITFLFVFQNFNYVAKAESNENWTLADCEEVALFITENFDTFVKEYNKTLDEDDQKLLATYVEDIKYIQLVEDQKYAAYLDFNDNNGYVVVTGSYNIYELETEGDLQCLNEYSGVIYYSYIDGFLYLDDEMNYQKFEYRLSSPDKKIKDSYVDSKGRLKTDSIDSYLEDKYSGYSLEDENTVSVNPKYGFADQGSNTYYVEWELDSKGGNLTGKSASEGNCALSAVYNTFYSLCLNGYCSSVPYANSYNMVEEIKNDVFYAEFSGESADSLSYQNGSDNTVTSSTGSYKYSKWSVASDMVLMSINEVYKVARDYAVDKCNYSPDGGLLNSNIPKVFNYTANYYNSTMTAEKTTTTSDVTASIADNKAVCMSISDNDTYGDHAVVVVGYKYISYTTGVWIFSSTKYIYLYKITDGWDTNIVYLDIKDTGGSVTYYTVG